MMADDELFGGAVNHCQAHFFGGGGNQLDGIPALGNCLERSTCIVFLRL